jgi:hypothetical protein
VRYLDTHCRKESLPISKERLSPMCASEELFVPVPGVSTMGGKHFYISFAFSSL